MKEDEKYMHRCIQLAYNGLCTTSPNPMVGAVLVYKNHIIGEGYHIRYGDWHAEVNAIHSVKDKTLLKKATLYVSLEPCSHFGKTPPCVDLIIKHKIPRVVIGCEDPSAKVNGKGIKKLIDSGIDVKIGILEQECRLLIKKFTIYNTLNRPYITLKWAESADKFIAGKNKHTIISTPYTSIFVHKLRAENNAILIGTNTAEIDDPTLTTRYWYGKNPIRIILDRNLRLSPSLHIFNDHIQTLIITTKEHLNKNNIAYITLSENNYNISSLLKELNKRNIQSLLVEGGCKILQSFINEKLWDEIFIEKGELLIKEGTPSPEIIYKDINEYQKTCFFNTIIEHYSRLML